MKTIWIILIGVLPVLCLAQQGCTDPQANNFDMNAVQNDGSCTYPATSVSTPVITNLATGPDEASGLAFFSGRVWSFNDSGGDPVLYGIDTITGNILKEWHVHNYGNEDWEDIAVSSTHVFIGDVGNNNGTRTNLAILKLSLDSLTMAYADTTQAEIISFSYPDQTDFSGNNSNHNFDCEAMLFWNDSLHLFSKDRGAGYSKHYVLPSVPGNYVALLRDSVFVNGQVTGADISHDSVIVLCGYQAPLYTPFMVMLRDFRDNFFFTGHKRRFELGTVLNNGQQEGICFTQPQSGFIASEKVGQLSLPARIYRFNLTPYITEPVLSISSDNDPGIFPNPFSSQFNINIPGYNGNIKLRVTDTSGRIVLRQTLKMKETPFTIRADDWVPGVYALLLELSDRSYFSKLVKLK